MNRTLLPILIAVLLVGLGTGLVVLQRTPPAMQAHAPSDAPSAETEPASGHAAIEDGTYILAEDASVAWEGRKKVLKHWIDTGTLELSEGRVTVTDGAAEGRFVFDMASIASTGSAGTPNPSERLNAHLKSEDFFDAANHPTAEFVLTGAEPAGDDGDHTHLVTGEMTIKGITHGISFPATITGEDGALRIAATADLDRTRWDVRYGSDKFFDNLADNVIEDFFSVSFDLVAEAQE